jgi:acyl dehydratase
VEADQSTQALVAGGPINGVRSEWRVTFRGAVRPGDRLHVRGTITSKRLASSGNRGVVTSRNDVVNQHDESPITIDVVWLIATRDGRS